MAKPEHVTIVKRGVAAIRAWKKAYPRASLELREANLSNVGLIKADLFNADLREADLSSAALFEADLRVARLNNADLRLADLRGANLSRADLSGANLSGAALHGANLSECNCLYTVFGAMDLSEANGLEGVLHFGPSVVGVDTLFKSKGKIPEVFLRGCGLSDWEIEAVKLYDPELSTNQILEIQYRVFDLRAGSPIQIGSLFISYTHADRTFVDALERKLNEKRIRFWRDIHDAPAGPLDRIVDRAIRLNPTMLLVLSKDSVESRWVEYEANLADKLSQDLGRDTLCPVALDEAWKKCRWSGKLRTQIEKYNILPFKDWEDPAAFERMFQRLVEGLSIFYQPEKPRV